MTKLPTFLKIVLLSLILFSEMDCSMAATNKLELIELSPLPNGETANSVKLERTRDGIVAVASTSTPSPILGATTHYFALPVGGRETSWKTVASISQMVPSMIAWDAVILRDGLQLTYELAGGAVNAIIVRTPSGVEQSVTASVPLESFSKPRFEHTDGNAPVLLTAVLDQKQCVVLQVANAMPYQVLADCEEGVLIRNGTSFLLFYKVTELGPVRGNSTLPGRLYALPLNDRLQKSGPASTVTDSTIYEFDAVLRNGQVAVCATTPDGVWIGRGESQGSVLRFPGALWVAPITLASPTLAFSVANGGAEKFKLGVIDLTTQRILVAEF